MEQLLRYADSVPEKFQTNFSDYAFVLWEASVAGSATQAWELYLKENPAYTYNGSSGTGEIVSIRTCVLDSMGNRKSMHLAMPAEEETYEGYYQASDYFTDFRGREDFRLKCEIVIAYPKEYAIANKTIFTNEVQILLHPADGYDEDILKTSSANWTWANYQWSYKGNTIGVTKTAARENYTGWMDMYRQVVANSGNTGEFPFSVRSESRGYGYTHNVSGTYSQDTYLNGSSYKVITADDVIYAYPLTGSVSGQKLMLSDEDYYFTEISIMQTDQGYDIYEDEPAAPEPVEKTPGINRNLEIYAMYKGGESWELADTVEWDPSGQMKYVFPRELLNRQPWRVKAVHSSVDYKTQCDISLKIRIRPDSPAFQKILTEAGENTVIRLENLGAVSGMYYTGLGSSGVWYHDQSTAGSLYQEENLAPLTQNLYGTIAMRDCRLITLSSVKKRARAQKYASAANNPAQERIEIQYTVSAWEGYEVYSDNMLPDLKKLNLQLPERKQAVFYDLLPFGVQFDPSKEIRAGRITGTSETECRIPSLWDEYRVNVRIDPAADVIQNYRGTGRTLLRIHVSYEGEDPSFFRAGMWGSGFGISFRAYCSWSDMAAAQEVPNVCAYMPENGDYTPILGEAGEAACDDGLLISAVNPEDYSCFGSDINEDGITDIPNILYCRAMAFEDIASAMQSGIVKTVRGEENRFGTFERSADVHLGEAYTYDITVTNVGRQPLKEIVIFDRLEQAAVDRREEEKEFSFQDAWWYGTLQSIDTALLRELDIQPVVYYHASREDAPIPDGTLPAKAVLTAENGWQEASTWEGTLEEVEAIAMDVSRKTDGSEFKLANMETLSFQMTLKAPEIPQNAVYAYNNASFYSVSEGLTETETISQMVVGNSTRVKLEECSTLEIIKEVTGEVPDCGEKEAFLFHVSFSDEDGKKVPYASREYVRYFQAEGQWMRKEGIFATDGQGRLYLQAGEKAVFTEKAGVSGLSVSEEPSLFWDTGITEKITGEIRQLIFQNTYRPVLYLEKKLTGIPKGKGLTEDEFHFQVLCGGEPAAEKEFWYVDQAAVYGTVPNMLAVGETDVNGVVSIHAGEVIALFPGQVGEQYTVTEMPDSYGEGTNWLPVKTSAEGTLTPYGDRVILENSFRWKDLYLKKALTCQETERCQAEFSFQIWELCDSEKNGSGQPEASEKLVTGKNWELLDAQLQPLNPPVTGRIGEDGILSCACAGKNIRIQNLEGKKIYCIREIQIPENYIPINDGIAEITMPVYADSANVEISNEYLLRPLRVSKLVIPGKASEEKPDGTVKNENITRRFTMKLLVKEEGEFLPKTNFPYVVEKNGSILRSEMTDSEGSFEISNAETAVFESLGKTGTEYRVSEIPDAEYPPVYPTEGSFAEGILAKEGSSLTVINGSSDSLIFQKKYTAAKGDVLMENALKTAGFRKSEFLKSGFFIETDAGNGWEQTEIDILCINTVDGSTRTVMTGTEAPLILIGTEIAVIQNLEKGTPFRITEMPEYQHRIFTDTLYTNSYITVSQVIPKENAPFTGIVGTELVGSITNELRSFHIGSRIYKSMLNGSQAIPDGAELVFRIEKWNGAFWQPAGNIRYTVMGGNKSSAFTGEVQVTKEDGLIHIYKTPDGIPSVQFEDEVRIKGKEEANSDAFRIEEVTELSDEAYGHLIGYSSSMLINNTNTIPIYDMPSETTDTFVNSNITKSIEIEKRMDTECKQEFTMCLRPLTEVGNDYGQSASYLSYTVFDSDTNAMIREGKTLEDGTFSLLAGEYARFYLPDGSHWTVSEIQPYPYQLDYVESNGSNIEVRTDNTVNISLLREASGLLTREMVMFGVFDTDSGLPIPLTEGDITIPETVMYRGQKIRITGIGERAFEGCGKLTSVTIPSHISLIGQYAFHDCGG